MRTEKKEKIIVALTIVIFIVAIGFFAIYYYNFTSKKDVSFPDVIRYEDVVWMVNDSVTSESEVQDIFSSFAIKFWDSSFDFLRSHNIFVTYMGNYTPILEQMKISLVNLTSINPQNTSQKWGPLQWAVSIPAVKENWSWRIGSDGFIEEKYPSDRWLDAGYVWFLIEQQKGIVRVIC